MKSEQNYESLSAKFIEPPIPCETNQIDFSANISNPRDPELALFSFQPAGENQRPSDIGPDPKQPPTSVAQKIFQVAFTAKDNYPANGSVASDPENYNPFLEA